MAFKHFLVVLVFVGCEALVPRISSAKKHPTTTFWAAPRSSEKFELNGWSPNENQFAWGLPGSVGPFENFDPCKSLQSAFLGESYLRSS